MNTEGRETGLTGQSSPSTTALPRSALFTSSPGGTSTTQNANGPVVISTVTETKAQHTWYTLTKLEPACIESFRQNCQIAEQKGVDSRRNENIAPDLVNGIVRQLKDRHIEDFRNWKKWDNILFFSNFQKAFGMGTAGVSPEPATQIVEKQKKYHSTSIRSSLPLGSNT